MATQREVSEHLGLSVASISELIKKGVLPSKRGRSPLDIDVCRHSYIGYLRKLAGYHKKKRIRRHSRGENKTYKGSSRQSRARSVRIRGQTYTCNLSSRYLG